MNEENQVQQEEATPTPNDGLILIEDANLFGTLVSDWHANRMHRLRHMLAVPEGTEIEVDGEPLVLTGDAHRAFVAAMTVAISELEQLPFSPVEDSTDEQPN